MCVYKYVCISNVNYKYNLDVIIIISKKFFLTQLGLLWLLYRTLSEFSEGFGNFSLDIFLI